MTRLEYLAGQGDLDAISVLKRRDRRRGSTRSQWVADVESFGAPRDGHGDGYDHGYGHGSLGDGDGDGYGDGYGHGDG